MNAAAAARLGAERTPRVPSMLRGFSYVTMLSLEALHLSDPSRGCLLLLLLRDAHLFKAPSNFRYQLISQSYLVLEEPVVSDDDNTTGGFDAIPVL